jgi:hypothetical protein
LDPGEPERAQDRPLLAVEPELPAEQLTDDHDAGQRGDRREDHVAGPLGLHGGAELLRDDLGLLHREGAPFEAAQRRAEVRQRGARVEVDGVERRGVSDVAVLQEARREQGDVRSVAQAGRPLHDPDEGDRYGWRRGVGVEPVLACLLPGERLEMEALAEPGVLRLEELAVDHELGARASRPAAGEARVERQGLAAEDENVVEGRVGAGWQQAAERERGALDPLHPVEAGDLVRARWLQAVLLGEHVVDEPVAGLEPVGRGERAGRPGHEGENHRRCECDHHRQSDRSRPSTAQQRPQPVPHRSHRQSGPPRGRAGQGH